MPFHPAPMFSAHFPFHLSAGFRERETDNSLVKGWPTMVYGEMLAETWNKICQILT